MTTEEKIKTLEATLAEVQAELAKLKEQPQFEPKRNLWEEAIFSIKDTFYIDDHANIELLEGTPIGVGFLNSLPTERAARQVLAECQLRMIAHHMNGEADADWINWGDASQGKYTGSFNGELEATRFSYMNLPVIYFKRKEDLQLTFDLHRDLWLQYLGVNEA